MEQRIKEFIELKEQLIEVYHELAEARDGYAHSNLDWDSVREIYEKAAPLETQLNEAVKALSQGKLDEIIEKDLKACVDNKTADPLLWACGLNLKELPMSVPLIGSYVGVEYSPGVWLYIGPGEHRVGNLQNLCFHVEDTNENHSFYSGFKGQDGMAGSFLGILETAEAYREDAERNKRISNFIGLKEKLVAVSKDCLEGCDRYEEKRDIETRLNEAVKTLSAAELDEIVRKDLQFCVDRKIATPLLWMCGLDLNELPEDTAFGVEYSPDLLICIEISHESGNAKSLCFTIESEDFWHPSDFNLNNVDRVFDDVLETAESYRKEIEGEELTDEER